MPLERFVAIISGPWGIVATLGLIVLLIGREVVGGVAGGKARRWRRGLGIGAAPLLALFALVAVLRLLGPIQAVLGAASETMTETVASVVPTMIANSTPTAPALSQAAPTTAPTTSLATATIAPPAMSTPTAPPDGGALVAQVRAAGADVRRGMAETTLDYGGGITAVSTITFDLGDGQQPLRLLVSTTYKGATGSRTVRRLTIGSQTWQRGADATWMRQATADDVRAQVAEVLPQPGATAVNVTFMPARVASLRWYEATRDADIALQVDAATGVPQEERRTIRSGGQTVVVRYLNWNGPVDIPNLAP